jgi:hypothetical protein
MSKHTLEQVLEALINKEDDRASELLHQYFVSKGKSIYEELSQFDEASEEDLEESEEEVEESIGGAADQDFEDEIIADETELEDETLFGEAEGDEEEDPMSADEPAEDEATMDLAMGDDAAGEEPAEEPSAGVEGDAEEAMQKVDDALADLKAIFADLMGEEKPAGDEPTEESFDALGESADLVAVPAPTHGDNGQNTKSPVSSGSKISANGAKAVDFTGEADKGMANPGVKTDDMGNVNKPGNKKAPQPKAVSVPKTTDAASNKTSPVAKN